MPSNIVDGIVSEYDVAKRAIISRVFWMSACGCITRFAMMRYIKGGGSAMQLKTSAQ